MDSVVNLARSNMAGGHTSFRNAKDITVFWKSDLFDPAENPEEFDEQVADWEKDWMLDADGKPSPDLSIAGMFD